VHGLRDGLLPDIVLHPAVATRRAPGTKRERVREDRPR
jgi:hypothetical protein